jgi:hypothetical protein
MSNFFDEDMLRLLFGDHILMIGIRDRHGTIIKTSDEYAEICHEDSAQSMIGKHNRDGIFAEWTDMIDAMDGQTRKLGKLSTERIYCGYDHTFDTYRHHRVANEQGHIISAFVKIESAVNSVLKSYDFEKNRYIVYGNAALTRDEMITLLYYLKGMPYKAVATSLCISPRTVDSRLTSIAKKIGCGVAALRLHFFASMIQPEQIEGLCSNENAPGQVIKYLSGDGEYRLTRHEIDGFRDVQRAIARGEPTSTIEQMLNEIRLKNVQDHNNDIFAALEEAKIKH